MFSAFKRLVGNPNETRNAGNEDFRKNLSGVQLMDSSLQRKFSKGVQYNMKIIIKGDRNVGKTCLFYRLQGEKFKEDYVPTDEIQVASIQWNYKATDDIVKVEVWDIVDKGKKKKAFDGLKLDNKTKKLTENLSELEQPALDADFIDVYKGTNGVIMLLDMTKAWTFDYVQRELPKVPVNIPVLVLANHRDMGHHRLISEDQVRSFIETLDRNKGAGQIRYAESSMRNGFGLKFLHKFFNLPFLHLQRETLLKQIEINQIEIESTCSELDVIQESDEQNYERFLNLITDKRRAIADQLSQVPANSFSSGNNKDCNDNRPVRSVSMPLNLSTQRVNNVNNATDLVRQTPSIIIGAHKSLPVAAASRKKDNLNNNFNKNQTTKSNGITEETMADDDQLRLKSFLEDTVEATNARDDHRRTPHFSESDDGDDLNPMVSKYQDDLDPEDVCDADQQETSAITVTQSKQEKEEENKIESNVFNAINIENLRVNETSLNESERSSVSVVSSNNDIKTATADDDDNDHKIGVNDDQQNEKINKKVKKTKTKKKSNKQKKHQRATNDEQRKLEEFLGSETNSTKNLEEYESL